MGMLRAKLQQATTATNALHRTTVVLGPHQHDPASGGASKVAHAIASESSVCALLGPGSVRGSICVSTATNMYAIPRTRGELSEAGPCRHMHGAALCRVQDTIVCKKTTFT